MNIDAHRNGRILASRLLIAAVLVLQFSFAAQPVSGSQNFQAETPAETPPPEVPESSTSASEEVVDPSVQGISDPIDPAAEWSQEAHDAQHSGFVSMEPARPWSLAWTWNGPDSSGGSSSHFYDAPKNAHTVTGGSFVFVPAGSRGMYALFKSDGQQAWNLPNAVFNATPAFDPITGFLFAGAENGKVYQIEAATGRVTKTYRIGTPINKPVLLVNGYVYAASDDGRVVKLSTTNLRAAWTYRAGSPLATMPAFSPSRGLVVFATQDLFVHAVNTSTGNNSWRVKPTPNEAVYPYSFEGYWPVIAEQHGIAFFRLNLGMDALWSGPGCGEWGCGIYPSSNTETRALLEANNGVLKTLFALDLSTGAEAFTPAVGAGGLEGLLNDSNVLENGPMPVVRVLPDGSEVAYIQFRSGQGNPPDGRWDTKLGEMVLDDATVPGLAAGDLRFISFDNSYMMVTDEQVPLTMAGDTIFNPHWGAAESTRILDRSVGYGLSYDNPIPSQVDAPVVRRLQSCGSPDTVTHWADCSPMLLFNDGRTWNGPGWWVYWNVMDPPTPPSGSYNDGLKPRYSYFSDGLVVLEGNGGELFVLRSAGDPTPTVTPPPTNTPIPTGTPIPLPTATQPASTPTHTQPATLPPTATRTATQPSTATRTPTQPPTATRTPTLPPTATRTPTAQPSPTPTNAIILPGDGSEWMQEAHDAQHSGFIPEVPLEPWSLSWTWNGPDANGGTGSHTYNAPKDARTVTGGSYVYVPAGAAGLYALNKSNGQQAWQVTASTFSSTPAYEPQAGMLFAGGSNGTLYKINAASGAIAGTYNAGSPLSKAVLIANNYVYVVSDDGRLHKINMATMASSWVYIAGSTVATMPTYSQRGILVYATDDLYIHAVRDNDGSQLWRVKPTSHSAVYPYSFEGYWPVIAEQHGIVFVRLNLGMNALWSGPGCGQWGCGIYPSSNADTRLLLLANNGELKNLFALNINTGAEAFVPAVGFGGVEGTLNGGPVLENGPMPVIKTINGAEVAYIQFRSGQGNPNDGRWDSHLGEMVLDNTTINGLFAGDLRFVDFPGSYTTITDETTPLTMAGDTIFNAHWGASESARILDRSASRGLSHASPITAQSHPTIIRRQQTCGSFNPTTHWTTCGLTLFNDGRYWNGPGWWTYWNVMDPPTPPDGAYSEGILPRYTYISAGLMIVEGNGGEIMALSYTRQNPTPTPIPTQGATATRTSTQAATSTRTPTPAVSPTATRTPTPGPTATRTPTATSTPVATTPVATTPPPAGRISNVQILTGSPARYDMFEVQFNAQTSATNLYMPYDPNPPAGLQAGQGINASGLFSNDNWTTTLIQPAFYYQPYTYSVIGGEDHYTPTGASVWRVRFSPQQAGSWQFRIKIEDSSGTEYYPGLSTPAVPFTVAAASSNPYTRRGFLGVSPNDSRYFQFQDGSPFVGVGFNDGFDNTTEVNTKMTSYEQNKMNFMRVWMSGDGINGSQWTSWASHHLPNDNYLPGVSLDTANAYNGSDVSMRLDSANPCLFADFWQGGIPVEPNTSYTVRARVRLSAVSGPGGSGFVIKQADWLGTACTQANGTRIVGPVSGTTAWTTLQGTYTTGAGQNWLGNLYLARENVSGGNVYIDEVRLYKTNDPSQVNLLREPNANSHMYFDPMSSAQWDQYIQSAEQHGVYLKLVIDEKNEWIRNRILPNGSMGSPDNNNFYAAANTKGRWLQEAWWRYLIARWGYSTAVHSFEYINEGDPFNGNHYEAAEAMAKYFDDYDPSRHMVTTSFWASFPNQEFWSNAAYSHIDYADLHAYISTGWGLNASFLDSSLVETNAANIREGNASARISGAASFSSEINPRGLVIQGQGEWIIRYWMKASSFTASCPYATTGGMQRVRWRIDGGNYYGGKEGVTPFNNEGKDFVCTSPAGTYDWTLFSSDKDRSGVLLPAAYRIILNDNLPHTLELLLENSNGTYGTAWVDQVEIVSPDGRVQPVIGDFDITAMDEDTAWYNHAYADVFSAGNLTGARKPLVRGETGIDFADRQEYNPDLLLDTDGIWLHNNLWAQVNEGAMYDLFWWADETIPASIYDNYAAFRNFMEDIPLSNGNYRDANAVTSNASLRAWGQRDEVNGRMHLWVQNTQHTWKKVVSGGAITPINGTITLTNVPAGTYRIEWWNTYTLANPVFRVDTITVTNGGILTLTLPLSLSDDVAVKVIRQ